MSNNSNNSNNSSIGSPGEYERQMLETAMLETQRAREAHKLALKKLGDAKKQEQKAKKMSKLSKKLSRALAGNEINSIRNLRELHNKAERAGVEESYGPIYSRKQTPLGRAKNILGAHQKMMNISRSIKNPSKTRRAKQLIGRALGFTNHQSNIKASREELEAAYEKCEEYGVCDDMEEIFDQLADLEDERNNNAKRRNAQTAALVASMPANQLIQRHRGDMLFRDRYQPERISRSVFYTDNQGRLRAHSISNQRNMRTRYNNNVVRQNVMRGNLPMVKRRKSVKKSRRKSV